MTKADAKDLVKMTRTKLVEEAHNYPEIVGASGMAKEELIEAIHGEMRKLGVEIPEAPAKGPAKKKAKKKLPDKARVKGEMKALKERRREALAGKDAEGLKRLRRRYRSLNRILRRAAALAK